ncbi:MAG: hypothetical protein ABSA92_11685 [Candidatus Bathyarchaeia archaeon]
MEKTSEREYGPQLRAYLELAAIRGMERSGPVIVVLRVTNIGRAPAIDIDLLIKFTNSDNQHLSDSDRSFKKEVLLAFNHSDLILCPPARAPPTLEYIPPEISRIEIGGGYKDVDGNNFSFNQTIVMKDFVDTANKMRLARNITRMS